MSAGTDMNQKIISVSLEMVEEQRRHIHSVLDEYVDQVITAGRQWTKSVERNKSSFVKVHKIITKAMEFLSLKCDEMECEQVLRDSYVDNTGDFSVAEPVTTHKESTEDDSHDFRNPHTNLENDQRARNEDVYKQLQNILAKQDGLDQQVNMKLGDLREEMKSGVDQISRDLLHKVDEIDKELSAKVDKINTELLDKADRTNIDDLSDKIDEINTELSDKVDEINLTAKVNKINKKFSDQVYKLDTDLTNTINEINRELSEKIDEINTELSEKVGQIDTDLSKNADQINVVLETVSNSEQEHAAQINKIVDLENHVNTVEKDMQNNVRQVEQQLGEVGTNYMMIRELFISRLAPLEKLLDILNERATSQNENVRQLQAVMAELKDLSDVVKTCAIKSEAEVVAFNADTMFSTNDLGRFCVHPFQSPRLISGCQFDSTTGKFTAVVGGFYLVYINLCITHDGFATIYLMHGQKSKDRSVQICLAKANIKEVPVSNIGIVEMKVDDELFIMIDGNASYYCLYYSIQFSCLRFG